MNKQLTLNISSDPAANFENFFWQNNVILQDTLMTSLSCTNPINSSTPSIEKLFFLWGEPGCGKSHLLQASCHYLGKQGYPCAYLPLKQFIELDPAIFDNLEQLKLIAIDDLEQLAGNPAWEEALFHSYNKIVTQEQTRLIMTASCPIGLLNIQLPDLRSRLSACMIFHITSLDEEACLNLLQERAIRQGLHLPDDVAHFLIRRFPRNPGELLKIFEQLDQAALKEKHRLTIPFVKKTLAL